MLFFLTPVITLHIFFAYFPNSLLDIFFLICRNSLYIKEISPCHLSCHKYVGTIYFLSTFLMFFSIEMSCFKFSPLLVQFLFLKSTEFYIQKCFSPRIFFYCYELGFLCLTIQAIYNSFEYMEWDQNTTQFFLNIMLLTKLRHIWVQNNKARSILGACKEPREGCCNTVKEKWCYLDNRQGPGLQAFVSQDYEFDLLQIVFLFHGGFTWFLSI